MSAESSLKIAGCREPRATERLVEVARKNTPLRTKRRSQTHGRNGVGMAASSPDNFDSNRELSQQDDDSGSVSILHELGASIYLNMIAAPLSAFRLCGEFLHGKIGVKAEQFFESIGDGLQDVDDHQKTFTGTKEEFLAAWKEAIQQNPSLLSAAPSVVQKDPDIVLAAVKQNPGTIEWASDPLKKDPVFIARACYANPNTYFWLKANCTESLMRAACKAVLRGQVAESKFGQQVLSDDSATESE